MLEGSDVCLTTKWSAVVRAVRVPVLLLQGDQEPQSPVTTINKLAADDPQLEVRFLPGTGQLLWMADGPQVLGAVERVARVRTA